MDQNNSRDQNFAPSFRNDSHISSRNEYRTTTPSFQNDSHISFQNEIGTFAHFEETVICYFEGIVIFFRKDRHLSSRKENWRSHINRSLIHHFKGTAYIQFTFNLYGTLFQPTVLCVIQLEFLPLVRITHKTAGTPEAKIRLSMINLWDFISK